MEVEPCCSLTSNPSVGGLLAAHTYCTADHRNAVWQGRCYLPFLKVICLFISSCVTHWLGVQNFHKRSLWQPESPKTIAHGSSQLHVAVFLFAGVTDSLLRQRSSNPSNYHRHRVPRSLLLFPTSSKYWTVMSDEGWRGNTHGQFSIPYTRVWTKTPKLKAKLNFQN